MNYYELLGVNQSADVTEIKRAYFGKVKQYSPERDPEMFSKIREAYDALKDTDSRKDYSSAARLPDDQSSAHVQELLSRRKYKEAVKILKELSERYPESEAVKLTLAKTYEQSKEFGNASKVFEALYKSNPKNQGYATSFARCLYRRGHNKKAYAQFEKAIGLDVKNAEVWTEWAYTFAEDDAAEKVIEMAEAFSKDMLKANYDVYAEVWLNKNSGSHRTKDYDLFKKYLAFYEKDTFPSKERVLLLFECLREAADDDNLDASLMEKGLELAKKSADMENKHKLNYLLVQYGFNSIDRNGRKLDVVFHDLTAIAAGLTERNASSEMNNAKAYIISKFSKLQGTIIYLKENYPDIYAFNEDFFERILEPQKRKAMENSIRRLIAFEGEEVDLTPAFIDDLLSEEPFTREQPKVGRNDPCPCGSGKKYKKCCGV